MIGRIDELAQRLVSFFVLPVLNLAIVSLLLHWCLADQHSVSSLFSTLDVSGLTRYFANLIGAIVTGNFDTIKELAGRYSNQIATVSNILVILLFLTILIAMVLLDRAIYFAAWLVPVDVAFDLGAYGTLHGGDVRLRRLASLLGQPFDFATAAGAVRSFLGEHSIDAYRAARRNGLIRSQSIARTGFDYAKSYVCLLTVAWLFAIVTPALKFTAVTLCLVAAVAIAVAYLAWYSNSSEDLIEFDVDSFIWLRAYDRINDRFVAPDEGRREGEPGRSQQRPQEEPAAGPNLGAAAAPPTARGPLAILCLRHEPAGLFYQVYRLGCAVGAGLMTRTGPK